MLSHTHSPITFYQEVERVVDSFSRTFNLFPFGNHFGIRERIQSLAILQWPQLPGLRRRLCQLGVLSASLESGEGLGRFVRCLCDVAEFAMVEVGERRSALERRLLNLLPVTTTVNVAMLQDDEMMEIRRAAIPAPPPPPSARNARMNALRPRTAQLRRSRATHFVVPPLPRSDRRPMFEEDGDEGLVLGSFFDLTSPLDLPPSTPRPRGSTRLFSTFTGDSMGPLFPSRIPLPVSQPRFKIHGPEIPTPEEGAADCSLCMDKKATTALSCGHQGFCLDCVKRIHKCPFCRKQIECAVNLWPR
jgi:hypothetical protein